MKYYINYIEQTGEIKGFVQLDTNKNIEVTNSQYIEAQKNNKIVIDGENISFEKVDFRTSKAIRKEEINRETAELKQYLGNTDWITSKYNDEVTVLAIISKSDFIAKYQDTYSGRENARNKIDQLEEELELL